MRQIVFIGLLLCLPFMASATAQAGDILLWNGKRVSLHSNPLESRKDIDEIKDKLFKQEGFDRSNWITSCWRGYIAEWTITGNRLYLTNIYYWDSRNGEIKANLRDIFGNETLANGNIPANWVTAELTAVDGECLYPINDGYLSIYEKEMGFVFQEGRLVNHTDYTNKVFLSKYMHDDTLLLKFIYSQIDWQKTPPMEDNAIRVITTLTTGSGKKEYIVELMPETENELYTQEALRVVNLIPEWDYYYQHGKYKRVKFTLSVTFSKKMQETYDMRP